jgi:tRNA threonylcarbamoyladenosine biosynthesis protein TsaE
LVSIVTNSAEETRDLGYRIGKKLAPGSIVCFFGDLAAGKTTFIKGLVSAVTGCSEDVVNSPTFVYLNIYGDALKVYHFDLYRLTDPQQFLSLGFDEMLFSQGISCIEWSERIQSLLPSPIIRIEMAHCGETSRRIKIYGEKISI